ncbi:MAG: hypothetical protein K2M17_03730, partial [Bacilli bacterium]|nr:hypothetical protein [Bacilli bacterium]
ASYNFYMWVVSVELPKALPEGFLDTDLFMNGVKEKVDYYYGFKEEWKYGCYNPKDKNCTKFSVTLSNDYKFYTLIYILNKAFNKLTFQDNRNIQEITRSIENIYKVNGVYETELSDRWGTGNMRKRPLLHGYEVLRATCIKHGKLKNDPYNYDDVFDDASMFAETVCSDTQLKEEFLMEEFMFNTIF